jgi:hypothetical protein
MFTLDEDIVKRASRVDIHKRSFKTSRERYLGFFAISRLKGGLVTLVHKKLVSLGVRVSVKVSNYDNQIVLFKVSLLLNPCDKVQRLVLPNQIILNFMVKMSVGKEHLPVVHQLYY